MAIPDAVAVAVAVSVANAPNGVSGASVPTVATLPRPKPRRVRSAENGAIAVNAPTEVSAANVASGAAVAAASAVTWR